MEQEKPIIVSGNPALAAVLSALRSAVALVLAFALGRGWIAEDVVQLVTALVTLTLPAVGAYVAFKRSTEQVAIVCDPRVPDSVAKMK